MNFLYNTQEIEENNIYENNQKERKRNHNKTT